MRLQQAVNTLEKLKQDYEIDHQEWLREQDQPKSSVREDQQELLKFREPVQILPPIPPDKMTW